MAISRFKGQTSLDMATPGGGRAMVRLDDTGNSVSNADASGTVASSSDPFSEAYSKFLGGLADLAVNQANAQIQRQMTPNAGGVASPPTQAPPAAKWYQTLTPIQWGGVALAVAAGLYLLRRVLK